MMKQFYLIIAIYLKGKIPLVLGKCGLILRTVEVAILLFQAHAGPLL